MGIVQRGAWSAKVPGDATGKLTYAVLLLKPELALLVATNEPFELSVSKPIQYCVPLLTVIGVPKVNVFDPDGAFTSEVADPITVVGRPPAFAKIEHFILPV